MDTNELEVTEEEEETTVVEETPEDSDDPAVLKARIKKLEEKAIAQRERTKIVKHELAKTVKAKSNELDNGDLALLAVKGYENEEDMTFIQDKMQKWNKTLPEILRDNDVVEKLKGMKLERDVKNAMPSATKRTSAGNLDNLDYWTAKYDQTGQLPDNFELKSAVINAQVEKHNTNKPNWR